MIPFSSNKQYVECFKQVINKAIINKDFDIPSFSKRRK